MEDSTLIPATLPTQIGKLGAPFQSCWVQILGPTSHPDGGNYGTGKVTAFCIKDEDIYTFGADRRLRRNDEPLGVIEPDSGVFLMRVMDNTLYMWCHDLQLYSLELSSLPDGVPTLVSGWDTSGLLPNAVAMAIGEYGWLLTSNGADTCLSRWHVADGGGTLVNITFAKEPNLGKLTALALIDEAPYVADASQIYRLEQAGEVYQALPVFQIPDIWGGIAGMLGQQLPYNDPTPDGDPAFAHYLYAINTNAGQVQLIYPDYGKYTGTGAFVTDGEVCGNLQLGSQGLLYYVQHPDTGGISTVNALSADLIYLDGVGVAGNHITILPNLLMSIPDEASVVEISLFCGPDGQNPLGSVMLSSSNDPYENEGYLYDRTIYQTKNGQPVIVPILNPYCHAEGPALTLRFIPDPDGDGNVVLGDIIVDPHVNKPIQPAKRR